MRKSSRRIQDYTKKQDMIRIYLLEILSDGGGKKIHYAYQRLCKKNKI